MSEQPKTLALALLAFQADRPTIGKTAENPHFRSKFAPLDEVLDQTVPALNAVGLVVVQKPTTEETLVTRLIHAATGEVEESEMDLLMVKRDPQGQGSAITYARRYALLSMLGLAPEEDDDGNGATHYQRTRNRQGLERGPEATTGDGNASPAPVPAEDPTTAGRIGTNDVREPEASTAQIARLRAKIGELRGLDANDQIVRWWDNFSLGEDGKKLPTRELQKRLLPSKASAGIDRVQARIEELALGAKAELPPDALPEPTPEDRAAFDEVVA